MKYKYDANHENPVATWPTLKGKFNKNQKKDWWINSDSFIDEMLKKHYNDAIQIANTIHTPLLTSADKESFALEGLYEAAGTYDPSHRGEWNRGAAKFTTYLMTRIRSILLRELHLAKMQKRLASVDTSSDEKKYLRDVDNTSTARYADETHPWNDRSETVLDTYVEQPKTELPFSLDDVINELNKEHITLNKTQSTILNALLNEDTNEAILARQLGISRNMVNLHVKKIRKHLARIIHKIAPEFKLGE